ncbi:MAG: hypothetical protein ING63_02570 [Rhodocyclaceae bacterium]|nr:hypothetical protein [Rhodocyclaceae bacterium]
MPVDATQKSGQVSYYSAEGNRRICALKLLIDPELAPPKLRKAFTKLSEQWVNPIKVVPAAIFQDMESVRIWLDRTHNGAQGGIGLKSWNAEQKQRFDGGSKNRAAQQLLDYAQAEGIISIEDRVGKLTTVQRFLGNQIFREALGFESINEQEAGRTRPKADFDIMLKRFIRDLIGKKRVNSRMDREKIVEYARPLASLPGVTNTRIEAEVLAAAKGQKAKNPRQKKPKKPEHATHVKYEEEIQNALSALGNEKLLSLYHSICSVELDPHTPLVAIGVWSFFETLTACAGRNDGTSFDSYLSKDKLKNAYGITEDVKPLAAALLRILHYGNTTKHHKIAGTFNGDQLNNDMIALKAVILKCIDEANPNSVK